MDTIQKPLVTEVEFVMMTIFEVKKITNILVKLKKTKQNQKFKLTLELHVVD
jgi:hypothetical protein